MPVVLHIVEAWRGGTSRHVRDLVVAAQDVEHHLAVPVGRSRPAGGAPFDRAALEEAVAAGARVHRLGMDRRPWSPVNAAAVGRCRRLVSRLAPDIVHAHSSVGGAVARLAVGYEGPPVVYTPHGLAPARLYTAVERALGPRTGRLIAVSASEGRLVVKLRLVPDERLAVIPNGIDVNRKAPATVDLRASLGIPAGAPMVLSVARLVAQKAPERFVEICAWLAHMADPVHFVLIGEGPRARSVDRLVGRLGVGDRFHRVTRVDRAVDVLGQTDVFVLASDFEGGPYTPLEAMAAGVPVVLSDVVGNRDVVVDGVSGVVRPAADTEALAGAIAELLRDRERREEMGWAGRRRVEAVFDLRESAARTVGLYRELATRRSTRRLPDEMPASSLKSPDSSAAQNNS